MLKTQILPNESVPIHFNDRGSRLPMAQSCHDALFDANEGRLAREMFTERPFSKETVRHWLLGYCPSHVRYTPFPLLRGRLIVPVADMYGEIVAFAGRKIEATAAGVLSAFMDDYSPVRAADLFRRWDKAKWINEHYEKSQHLYGLQSNKEHIIKQDYVVIVEGNLSLVYLWQSGMRNTVAICGTKFSTTHLCLLKRLGVRRFVLLLDGDSAGRSSAKKTRKTLRKFGCSDILIAHLPQDPDDPNKGMDAEDFVRKHDASAIRAPIENALENKISQIEIGEDLDGKPEWTVSGI